MAAFNWRFDWDPEKALGNLAKHGISFEQAATVLKDPLAISIFDDEHSEGEDGLVRRTADLSSPRYEGRNARL